jgi:hypothetical protein
MNDDFIEDEGNVVILGGKTTLPIPPDRVLKGALGELESVIVIGHAKDGTEWHASSISDKGDLLFMVERFKKDLLEME